MNSRIKKIYIGAKEPKFGSVGSVLNLLQDYSFNHKVEIETGICEEESVKLLKDFFLRLRKVDKNLGDK